MREGGSNLQYVGSRLGEGGGSLVGVPGGTPPKGGVPSGLLVFRV